MPTTDAWLTSAAGSAAVPVRAGAADCDVVVTVRADRERQTLFGIGGALTQASAAALAGLSPARRAEVIAALFGADGARYSLCRTPVASCDFSTSSYSYAPQRLADFTVEEDERNGLLPLIRDARAAPGASFRLIGSPWTAPPWMKDNGKYFDPAERRGGRLLPEHEPAYAEYIARYVEAYAAQGAPVWAVTPVNEPHGNQGTWESMEMSAEDQRRFVPLLGRALRERGLDAKILVYDQNRKAVVEYAGTVLSDAAARAAAFGTAVHWYDSTFRVFEEELDRLHAAFPAHPILHTEGCIDAVYRPHETRGPGAPTPWWQDDGWYWRAEAKDWGWDWAPNPEVDHPPYVPAFRYARDLVVGMAHWLAGWVDWNVVLDRHGGPNHVGNYCLAPVLVDAATDAVHYTPLYHLLRQVSRVTRPGAVVLETEGAADPRAVAVRNPDGSTVVHLFNESAGDQVVCVALGSRRWLVDSPAASLLTVRLS